MSALTSVLLDVEMASGGFEARSGRGADRISLLDREFIEVLFPPVSDRRAKKGLWEGLGDGDAANGWR